MVLLLTRLTPPPRDGDHLANYVAIHKGLTAFAVEETGTDPEAKTYKLHYQSLVSITMDRDSLRKRFTNLKYDGNGEYAITPTKKDDPVGEGIPDADKDRCLRYLCKGGAKGMIPKVIINTFGLSDADIEAYHYSFWERNEAMVIAFNKKQKKVVVVEEEEEIEKVTTKKYKRKVYREVVYKEFIEYCKNYKGVETGKYDVRWIGYRFLEFTGVRPRPELENWAKGTVYSVQAVLLHGEDKTGEDYKKAAARWVERLI